MAELVQGEVLLPSLLDRLTDDNPKEEKESRYQRAETTSLLRKAVLRDLESLLNTTNLELHVDLENHQEVSESVLNYGLPNLSGNTISSTDLPTIEKSIQTAIRRFEPRLLSDSVRVKVVAGERVSHGNTVVFQIEATLWGIPMPEALFLRTELDLELGDVVLKEGDF